VPGRGWPHIRNFLLEHDLAIDQIIIRYDKRDYLLSVLISLVTVLCVWLFVVTTLAVVRAVVRHVAGYRVEFPNVAADVAVLASTHGVDVQLLSHVVLRSLYVPRDSGFLRSAQRACTQFIDANRKDWSEDKKLTQVETVSRLAMGYTSPAASTRAFMSIDSVWTGLSVSNKLSAGNLGGGRWLDPS
jgi:hypothetical protein